MHIWYLLSVWLHILAAAIWIGGMVFLGLVLVPVIRGRDFAPVRTALLYQTGLRFRWAGWFVLGLLVVTGIFNVGFRGYTWAALFDGTLWQGAWGHVLAWKMVLVGFVLVVSAVHDFYLGPRATRLLAENPEAPEAQRLRRTASYIGRLMLLASLVILALAVMLVRGGW
jgi:uncharacterized membrane protein